MGGWIGLINLLVRGLTSLIEYLKAHMWSSFILIVLFFLFKRATQLREARDFLYNKAGMIIIDGEYNAGKTRFMTTISVEAKKRDYIILGNFYSGYCDIRWNSIKDLENLLFDVWTLGEYQNFTYEQLTTAYIQEGKIRLKEKQKAYKYMEKHYPFIPHNGFFNRFLILGDEFQNLFFNRTSLANFSGDNKKFLKYLHQVRHFNAFCVFGTQKEKDLDVKFRRLSSYYLQTYQTKNDLIYGYNVYNFQLDKQHNLDRDNLKKIIPVPAIFWNKYKLNLIINKIEKLINKRIDYRFNELKFFSKFNADPDYDIYVPGSLFNFINEKYEDKKHNFETDIV